MTNVESLAYFVPELILTVTVLVVLIASIFGIDRNRYDISGVITLIGTVASLFALTGLFQKTEAVYLFEGMICHDLFSVFFRGFFIISTVIVILMTMLSREVIQLKKCEFYAILLSICIGMCLVASSQDMLMIYLALELMSLGSYILVGFSRKIGKSEEGSLKYVLYGGVSTGVMLFGLSLLYGLTGATNFPAIQQVLMQSGANIDLVVYLIFIFILVGAGYKIAMVPFHFWAPDVYEGAPTAVTAYLSVASKAAGIALLIRFFFSTFLTQSIPGGPWTEIADIDINWTFHIAVLSAITMTIGNLGALPQTSMKRLLAYSGIAHAGYLLMGVCVLTLIGIESVLFYLVMYLFTNLSAFIVVVVVVEGQDSDRISGFRGLWARAPWVAVLMTTALVSLVGLPPTAGFVGKIYLLYGVIQENLYWLAIVAVLNTVVSLYYYARVIRAMFLENPETEAGLKVQPALILLLWIVTIPVLVFGIWWNPLVVLAKTCAYLIP
jgi:NADH-quinone oxidoreductase subunit N